MSLTLKMHVTLQSLQAYSSHVCGFTCSVAGNKVVKDDIHLIMEYKKGEKWGNYEAPRSNR
jgi:hypothetical protein